MARTNPKNEVIERKPQPVAAFDASAYLQTQPQGPSDFDQRDKSVPFLRIVQQMSGEVTKGDPNFNKDVRPGDIATPNGTFIDGDEGVEFIPCYYRREGLVYRPQGKDWKFAGNLGSDYDKELATSVKGPNGETILENGNRLDETATYYGFVILDGVPVPAVIGMKNSQWKSAKRWNTIIDQYREKLADGSLSRTPIFWRSFLLKTDTSSNEKGTWFVWTVEPKDKLAETKPQLLDICAKLREEVLSGVKVARHEDEVE